MWREHPSSAIRPAAKSGQKALHPRPGHMHRSRPTFCGKLPSGHISTCLFFFLFESYNFDFFFLFSLTWDHMGGKPPRVYFSHCFYLSSTILYFIIKYVNHERIQALTIWRFAKHQKKIYHIENCLITQHHMYILLLYTYTIFYYKYVNHERIQTFTIWPFA